jgi:hypothetical protein
MRTIKRLGPPSVLNRLSSDIFQVAVTLDAAPAPAWIRFFRDTESWTGSRHPLFIDLKGSNLVFESTAEDLPGWVEDLDRWIRTANQACAEMFV